MRIFFISLLSLASLFASNYDFVEESCDRLYSLAEQISSVRGEVELLESRYRSYSEEVEGELEVVGRKFKMLRENLIRLRRSPDVGYEAQRNKSESYHHKQKLISLRKELARLQVQGKNRLLEYEVALKEKREQLAALESEADKLKETIERQLSWAKTEVVRSKKQLLSALKARKSDLERYQNAYQEATLRYKEWQESLDAYFR